MKIVISKDHDTEIYIENSRMNLIVTWIDGKPEVKIGVSKEKFNAEEVPSIPQ